MILAEQKRAQQRASMKRLRARRRQLARPWNVFLAERPELGFQDELTHIYRDLGGPKPPGSTWPEFAAAIEVWFYVPGN